MSSRLTPASQVAPESVSWFWQGRIPLGAITELIGGPGQAKSSITYDLSGRATGGRPMPGCATASPPTNVILLQAEDHPASTVVPSLKAAGADLGKVHLSSRLQGGCRPLRFPNDMGVIESAVTDLDAKLVVLDPVASYISGSLQSEQSVRNALMPFVTLAEKHNLAVLLVRHLRKAASRNPLHLGAGSVAFVAIARSSLLVGNGPTSDDNHRHVLTVSKANLASAPSLVYRTVRRPDGTIAVEWLGESETDARDIALTTGGANEPSALQEAMYVLYSLLCEGPLPANEVVRRATQATIMRRTLYRAKAALKVKSVKRGGGAGAQWFWRLPDDDDRPYRIFKEHDLERLMDQLCHGPTESDISDSFTDFPSSRNPRRRDEDEGQLV